MNTKNIKLYLPFIIFIALSALSADSLFANAQSDSLLKITFPIAELGNCKDKADCKIYCDIPNLARAEEKNLETRRQACDNFALKHNLGNAKERKEKIDAIAKDGGPGNCANSNTPYESCHLYCSESSNMKECIAWARANPGVMKQQDLEDAEKVLKVLEQGGKLPDGCENQERCKQTCRMPPNLEVARQCFEFAEKAGFLPPDIDPEKAKEMFRLASLGEI